MFETDITIYRTRPLYVLRDTHLCFAFLVLYNFSLASFGRGVSRHASDFLALVVEDE